MGSGLETTDTCFDPVGGTRYYRLNGALILIQWLTERVEKLLAPLQFCHTAKPVLYFTRLMF